MPCSVSVELDQHSSLPPGNATRKVAFNLNPEDLPIQINLAACLEKRYQLRFRAMSQIC
jgi:hypothetical protein